LGKTAIVFGGAGFIGTHLLQDLSDSGSYTRLVSCDIAAPRWQVEGVEYRTLDIRKPIDLDLPETIDEIYNLAAVHTTPGHEDWEYYWTNVLGATHVCDFARSRNVPNIVFTSSIAVYGPTEEPLHEGSDLRPESAYGKSKFCAEQIHHQWQNEAPNDRKLVVVRPAVIFGREERGNFTRMARMLAKNRFVFPGRTDTIKSCGYVKDLVASFAFALQQSAMNMTFNFAFKERYTARDIADAFSEVGGYKRAKHVLPLAPILFVGWGFEVLNALGLKTSINRARVMKLNRSTNIVPQALSDLGFSYGFDLKGALKDWKDDSRQHDFD
jgi:nucleoside-diphosphate-sugar epimerase